MEEKVKDEIDFEYGDKIYNKIFQIEELTELEKEKNRQLEAIITDFYQKVCPGLKKRYELKDLGLGYIEGYGYCTISFQERGFYVLTLLYDNFQEIYMKLLLKIAARISSDYCSHNHVKLLKVYEKRAPLVSHNHLLFFYEFILKLILKYFDNNIPMEFIKFYENILNYRDDYFYEYNLEVKRFIKKKN